MKELTKKSRIRIFIAVDVLISVIVGALIFAWSMIVVPQFGHREYNQKPDDELSMAVREATGKDFDYHGKEEYDSGAMEYEYHAKKLEKDAITNLVNALNDTMKNEQRKIRVKVWLEIPGGIESVFSVENFSDEGLEAADYDGMYAICIRKPEVAEGTYCDSPSLYTGIEGIKKLCINVEMKKQAEKEKIDWYELWPDLEEVEVVPR